MKILSKLLFNCSMLVLVPVAANAAGTYFNGTYQSPQRNYSQQSYAQRTKTASYSNQGISAYNQRQYANSGYTNARATARTQQPQQVKQPTVQSSADTGFSLSAGLAKQVAMWQFEMNTAGSKLHFDNIDWLVFDAQGKYVFDAGKTKMQINAGLQYGMQTGESSMIDDDISHGGYVYGEYWSQDGATKYGEKIGNALSAGVNEGGNMFGFNIGFGLTDIWKWGNMKITPSIGWRYLQYKLETKNNKGMVVVNGDYDASCVTLDDGSKQCWPLIAVFDSFADYAYPDYPGYSYFDKNGNKLQDLDGDGYLDGQAYYVAVEVGGWNYAEAEGTFYFAQPDVSHSYEVEWSGPYLALEMLYDINVNNSVNGYLELGLPSYTATADQPYRYDWQHPKSIEDKGGMGSAFHLGLGANWNTMITKSIALSIGVTYDYYTVSDADATTYLNGDYYMGIYNDRLVNLYDNNEEEMLAKDAIAQNIVQLESECPGWVCKSGGEIESFYKSMGIRVGINAKF